MLRTATFEHRRRKGIRISIRLMDRHGLLSIQRVVYREQDHTAMTAWRLPTTTLKRFSNETEAMSSWRLIKKQYGREYKSLGG